MCARITRDLVKNILPAPLPEILSSFVVDKKGLLFNKHLKMILTQVVRKRLLLAPTGSLKDTHSQTRALFL